MRSYWPGAPSQLRSDRKKDGQRGLAPYVAGALAGLLPVAEENIGARGAENGRAGILGDHQAAKRRRRGTAPRQHRFDPERRVIRPKSPIDGDRTQFRQRDPGAAGRPGARIEILLKPEKNV